MRFLAIALKRDKGDNRLVERRLDILPQVLLIVFDRQDVVAPFSTIFATIDFAITTPQWQSGKDAALGS
jgi:hypothetical protein